MLIVGANVSAYMAIHIHYILAVDFLKNVIDWMKCCGGWYVINCV